MTLSPNPALAQTNGTISFTPTITGSSNQAVTWSVQEASGCCSRSYGVAST